MTETSLPCDPDTASPSDDLRSRLAALEAENAALRRELHRRTAADAGSDDLLTISALNDDLRAVNVELEDNRRALAESERRLRAIFESATEHAILTIDGIGRVTSWNPGAARILGWSAEEILGHGFDTIFTEEDRQAGVPAAEIAGALTDSQRQEERRYRRKDGSRFWAAGTLLPLRGPDANGFLFILRDRTAEREREQAVRDARQRATDILESIDEAFVALDHEFRITFQNRRAQRINRLSLAEMDGRTIWDLWPSLLGTPVEAACRRAMAEQISQELEHRFGTDEQHIWLEIRYHPTPDGLGCFFRDVTDRKRAEDEASASHSRTVEILESISDAFYAVDHDWRFTYVNRKAEQLWGRSRDDLLGRVYQEAFPQIGSEAFDAHLTAAGERRVVTVETISPILHQWIEARIYPGSGGLSVYFRDVTERRNAQDALLRAKEEAERADLAKSKFLAAASHDLRQPLQSLLLFVDVLKPHVQSPRGQTALTHLGRGLDALKDLLDSLLDISRLDANIVEPVIEEFPIQPLIEHIGAAYQPVAAAKGLQFQVSACVATARSDRTLLTRMIRNLVENALRYTETGRIAIDCRKQDGRLRIEVRDTGIGIPPDHLDRIWEEFHQVGNQERDRNRGLGLGLAIVKRLSDLLDHPVDVRSALGRGACFGMEVPLGQPVAVPENRPTDRSPGRGRFAVLVDDDAIVLLGLETIFREWGYDVLVAGSADKAVDGLRKANRRPDIVVADYRLREGRFGTEAVTRIRDLYPDPIPGVILTGETGPDCERDAAAHGLGIIHKPVTPRQLSHALDQLFGGH